MSEKLKQLTCFLKSRLDLLPGQIDTWVNQCQIQPVVSNHGLYFELCHRFSDCTILIDRYTKDASLIAAQLTTWLDEHDSQRSDMGIKHPEIDVTPLDSGNHRAPAFEILISLDFIDPVLVAPDEQGAISWRGKRWSVIDEALQDTAEEVSGVKHE